MDPRTALRTEKNVADLSRSLLGTILTGSIMNPLRDVLVESLSAEWYQQAADAIIASAPEHRADMMEMVFRNSISEAQRNAREVALRST